MSSLNANQRASIFLLAAMLLGIMSATAVSAWSCSSDDNCTMGDSYDFGVCTPDNFVDAQCVSGTCTYTYEKTNCFSNDLTTSTFVSNASRTCIPTVNQTTDCTLTQGDLGPMCYTSTGTCDAKTLTCVAPPVNDTTGPEVLNVTFTKKTSQCEIKIDAFAEDQCTAVVNGEFFMGGSTCGPPGTGNHFDSITELKDRLSELIKNSTSTTDGSHNIFVRAQDDAGNWGTCFSSHIDIDCNPPEYPTCDIGNTVYNGYPDGILLQGTCNPNEKITCGDNVTIQANICDSESRIQLAEYFLDNQTLLNWGGTNMTASDGTFNEKCEDVTATIDTTKLSDGTHYVKVHGKDGQENWGKFDPFTNASFIVDKTPPKTEKILTPADKELVKCDITDANGHEITDGCAYVKPGTNITLSANDFNPDNNANGGYNDLPGEYAGNTTIHWNIYYSPNCLLETPEWSLQSSGTGELNEDVQLNLTQDSCHLVEYWATDGVCSNEETHHYELDIVDGKSPLSNKTIGDPKIIKGNQCLVNQVNALSFSDGDNLRQISGAYSRGSCSVNTGIAFDGTNLLVTCWYDNSIDFLSPADGSLQKSLNISAVSGMGAVSWDASRNMLWACEQGTNNVLLINTTTGSSIVMFHSNGCIDGLAYDGVDDTIWASPDASSTLTHYMTNGTVISVQNSGMTNSGIAVGGSKLYLADNGGQHIYDANKDLSNKQLFATFPARLEDLECDDITFAGENSGAIWSLDAYDRTINAWAIPQGQCGFGGLPPPPVCDNNESYVYITQDTPINLTCSDQNPHPVGDETLYYRYNVQEDFNETPGDWTDWKIYKGAFSYSEDSIHNLQWYCVDGLGNTETVHNETDIVDTQPPVINKTLTGPHSGECLPPNIFELESVCVSDGFGCVSQCMLSSSTEIHVNSTDPLPHPVDQVSCNWSYTVDGEPAGGENNVPSPFTINFPEESHHVLTLTCQDALGNTNRDVEDFYVDNTPPETDKYYMGPYFELADGKDSFEPTHWINSSTEIKLSATDTIGPHVSGVNYTKYRVTLVNDTFCYNQALCQEAVGNGTWNNYDEEFTITNQSCHLIEYYSTDKLNNTETIKKQCAFVDNTPPETNKTIGTPKYSCMDESKCGPDTGWQPFYVNESTPITISCIDQAPHPVQNEQLCYKISWEVNSSTCKDNEGTWDSKSNLCYMTNEFGEVNGNGYTCVDATNYTLSFKEDSLHNIEWYCADGLGNTGETNIEYDNVDSQPPWIIIDNPTPNEAMNVTRCMQSIVIETGDEKSGVNSSSVYAQLLDNESNIVENMKLTPIQNAPGAYEGLMEKDHPEGDYILKVCSSDNLGNQYCKEIKEYLPEMVSVNFINPSTCTVDPETGGTCDFTFNLCMRGGNTIQMWLDKFGVAGITPYMMNATINDTGNSTYVGLKHAQSDFPTEGTCEAAGHTWLDNECWTIFPAGELQLQPICNINGEDSFNLHLNITSDVAQQLGSGVQILKYWLNTSSQCFVPD